jgi:queuine tRNA-ribosyltransferase
LGIGHPAFVAKSFTLGYDLFDSAMPTRDARHGRLYRFTGSSGLEGKNWWEYIYIHDQRHIKSNRPIGDNCDCHTCQHYSIAYLHNLFKINDNLYHRLATIHNLYFMTQLCKRLRQADHD